MVANLQAPRTVLTLICEPDRPRETARAIHGWTRQRAIRNRIAHTDLRRDHQDDEYGARVQWAIVRYVLCGAARRDLAADLCVTETTAQSYLTAKAWAAYGQPVLRALARLGIGTGRSADRDQEILRAQHAVLQRAADALAGAPLTPVQRRRLTLDLRLLSITEAS